MKAKWQQVRTIRSKRQSDPEFKAADDQRMAAEKQYQRKTFKEHVALSGGYAEEHAYTLKWRLNWALLVVGFLIAAVYIILFFA